MSDHEDLPKLKKAKSFSDDANWHEKHVLLRSMLAEHPDRWEVDQDDGHQHAIGIRHESGFKFHLPREQVVGPVTAPAEKSAMSLMPSLSDMATSRLMKAISEDQVKLGPDGEIIVAPEEEAPLTPEEQAQDDMAAIAEQVAAMQRQRKAARPAYYDPRDWTAKTASAVVSPSLLTYVPGAALEAIRKNGLLSGNELAKPENRHLLELARGGDEGDSADAWLERRASRLKEQPWNTSYQGPSAIFGEADPDKITDKHPTKRFKSVPIRIKLQELLAKYPNTKLHGSELVPFNEDYDNLSAAQKDEHVKARHHDLTPEEITALIDRGRNPKDMWQHYNDPEGNMYAGNVPHTHIITPHGRIDPEFLDFGDLPSALELPEDGKYHPRSVKSAHIKCPNCQTTEGHLKLAGEAIICRECNRRSDITEWEEANPETSGSEKKATGAGATPVQPVAPPTPVKPLKTPTPVQPETMVVAPHTPAATGAKPNPGIYKAHQAPNFTGPTNPTSVVKSGGGNVGGMMTAMPTKPIPTIQFASSIKGPGETEDPQAKMEQEKEQAEQVKQLEAAQADSNTHKSTLAEMKEHQHSERMQMREQLMAHQQKLHEMKLENASLRAKADMASSMPEPQEHHGAKHVTDYAKQLHDKATSIMKKLSAVNPYYANLLWDRACKMAGVTPESGAAGEEEYYHKHNPGGFGTAMTNFGFHDKAMQDSAYNAINPTKPEAQWGMGDKMKHWGANLAAGAGWLGDALVSPFRYGTRSLLRAGSHFSEGNYGKGLMHGTLGVGSAALGVLPGVGALRGGIGAGTRLTGLARGMMTANIPQMAEGAKQPPEPMAPGAVAGTPTPTPGAPTSPSSDIPTMLKSWLGLSGDADATNYAGHFLPPALVSQNPGNEDSTDYKNPFLQKVMPTAMRFLTKGPAPESSMRAFAESEGSQGGIAPQEIRPGYLSPSTAMALQNTLYGGGMGL